MQDATGNLNEHVYKNILNVIDAMVYVVDMDTFELLFVNEPMKRMLSIADYKGQACWNAIHGRTEGKCAQCAAGTLSDNPGGRVVWECRNERDDRFYKIKSNTIDWLNGRMACIQEMSDITGLKDAITPKENLYLTELITSVTMDVAYMRAVQDILVSLAASIGEHYNAASVKVLKKTQNGEMRDEHAWVGAGITNGMESVHIIEIKGVEWGRFIICDSVHTHTRTDNDIQALFTI